MGCLGKRDGFRDNPAWDQDPALEEYLQKPLLDEEEKKKPSEQDGFEKNSKPNKGRRKFTW